MLPACWIVVPSQVHILVEMKTIGVGPEAGGGRPVKVIPESALVDVCSSLNMSTSTGSSNSIIKMQCFNRMHECHQF